jgi:hypothetical protein
MKDIFSKVDELSRKSFLLHAAYSTLGVSLAPSYLWGAENTEPQKKPANKPPCERVIFLYMRGGMSQTDTFDPKKKFPLVVKVNQSKHKALTFFFPINFLNWHNRQRTCPLFGL